MTGDNYEYYHDDVLSIEQMLELEKIGVDTSDASCMWTSIQDKDYNPIRWMPVYRGEDRTALDVLRASFPLTYKEGNIYYCYTISDILRKLPKFIDMYELELIPFTESGWQLHYREPRKDEYLVEIQDKNLISVAYRMMIWVAEYKKEIRKDDN